MLSRRTPMPQILDQTWPSYNYYVLSGAELLGTLFLVPKVKVRSPKEIDKMFVARVPTRSFFHWTNTSGM